MFIRHAKAKLIAKCLMSFTVCSSIAFDAVDNSRVARYTTTPAEPTQEQKQILETEVTVTFLEQHKTVGDAIRYVLEPNGYRLADVQSRPEMITLLKLPLPLAHRSLGPMALRDLLETLAGPAWRLIEDPVARLVAFELCDTAAEEGKQQ